VVAHLGNNTDGTVSGLLMCGGGSFAFPRRWIRPMLRYKVIPDPVLSREIVALLKEATARLIASKDTPERQRGLHSKPWLWRTEKTAPGSAAA
jgi:hypothetical protein